MSIGWYQDPDDPNRLRYWDGSAWAESQDNPVAMLASRGSAAVGGAASAAAVAAGAVSYKWWDVMTYGTGDTSQAWSGLFTLILTAAVAVGAFFVVRRRRGLLLPVVLLQSVFLLFWPLMLDGPVGRECGLTLSSRQEGECS